MKKSQHTSSIGQYCFPFPSMMIYVAAPVRTLVWTGMCTSQTYICTTEPHFNHHYDILLTLFQLLLRCQWLFLRRKLLPGPPTLYLLALLILIDEIYCFWNSRFPKRVTHHRIHLRPHRLLIMSTSKAKDASSKPADIRNFFGDSQSKVYYS